MNDRELLELAARAAGMPPPYDANDVFTAWIPGKDPHSEYGHWWDPLNDDGDALRLAVKLKLDIEFDGSMVNVNYVSSEGWLRFVDESIETEDGVRRAIVSAAAEIGRDMP